MTRFPSLAEARLRFKTTLVGLEKTPACYQAHSVLFVSFIPA